MLDKKDFGYSFPCDGPGRGGTCDIWASDTFYLAVFWMLNTLGWLFDGMVKRLYLLNSSQLINGYNPFAWAHGHTTLSNLIRWRDKPVALSIVQAGLELKHYRKEKFDTVREEETKIGTKYHLIRRSSKKKISKVASLGDKWEINGKIQSLPRSSAPTHLHRRCFLTARPRANYRDFGLSGHILREMVHTCLLLGQQDQL
ncbi:30S ribosomal protein S14 chloroplastic, partial [Bienertia sinuspersici]